MNEQAIRCPHCGQHFALDADFLDVAFREHFENERRTAVNAAREHAYRQTQKFLAEREIQHRKALDAREQDYQQKLEQARGEAGEAAERRHRDQARRLEEMEAARRRAEQQLAERDEHDRQAQQQLRQEAEDRAEEKYRLQLREKEIENQRIGHQLADLERRMRQAPVEVRGEALETWLKQQLTRNFPMDSIADVKKGQRGADLVQQVFNPRGQRCGAIVWEAKNTKNWNDDWLAKVREDRARAGADVGVIVSRALPRGTRTFQLIDGVWVSSVENAPALGSVLRQSLLQLHQLRRANVGREGKMETVYDYLVSEGFRDRVQRMVTTWEALRTQVDREERAMQRQWKERRKQLDAVIGVTTEIYTDISAVIGADEMPQVEGLSLDSPRPRRSSVAQQKRARARRPRLAELVPHAPEDVHPHL